MELPPLNMAPQAISSHTRKLLVRWTIVFLALIALWIGRYRYVWHEDFIQAARSGDYSRAFYLMTKQVDLNQRGQYGETPLMQAVWGSQPLMTRILIASGADFDAQDREGNTALIWAARCGDLSCARILIRKGATLDPQNVQGDSALMCATFNGFPKIAEQLVLAGADVNLLNTNGESAITKARQRGFSNVAAFLVAHGANLTSVGINKSPWPAASLTPAQHWALATPAILVQYNGDSHELLGAVPSSQRDRIQRILRQWWRINNRDSAIQLLDWLRDEGHRPNPKVRRFEKRPKKQEPLLAWDYCRLVWVAGSCYVSGYLSEEEAWERIMPAAHAIQRNYSSWREMGQDYLRGRKDWSGRSDPRFESVFELLCNPADANSPWNKNPWSLNLEDPVRVEAP